MREGGPGYGTEAGRNETQEAAQRLDEARVAQRRAEGPGCFTLWHDHYVGLADDGLDERLDSLFRLRNGLRGGQERMA